MNKLWYILASVMLLHIISGASNTTKQHRNWAPYNDRILFEILINLLNDENWRQDKSPYVQGLLKDIYRLSNSPALTCYHDVIRAIKEEAHAKEKA
jgi:hypothetical protein